jgi:DNA-binding transcriptional ArsR family regulator
MIVPEVVCRRVLASCGSGHPKGEHRILMTGKLTVENPRIEVFKALSDPIRWSIIIQMSKVDELACITLESTLPVAKPTISYHTKILQNAGLINTRKAGRNYYYSLRRDVLSVLLDGLWELAPTPRPVVGTQNGSVPTGRRQKRQNAASVAAISRQRVANDEIDEIAVLTW